MAAAWTWLLLILLACLAPMAQAQITPIVRYPIESHMQAMRLIAGPDGKMWFTGRLSGSGLAGTKLMQMDLDGTVLASHLLTPWSVPSEVAAGPDGNVWANVWGNTITRVSPDGSSATFTMPPSSGSYSTGISAGPDGKVWMVLQKGLARIAPDGTSVGYTIPTPNQLSGRIIWGNGADLWFSNVVSGRINRLDTITGSNQIYDLQSMGLNLPNNLALGADGQIWFTIQGDNRIGRINPQNGQIDTFTTGKGWLSGITAGPDGNLWYVSSDLWDKRNVIGRITPQGIVTEYPMPPNTGGSSITTGPDGKLWYIETVIDPVNPNTYNIATFGLPATVTASVSGPGGSLTPTRQVLRIGVVATLSIQPSPTYLVDKVTAQGCSPVTSPDQGVISTATLTGDCLITASFTQPQCTASPAQGFVGTSVSLQCSGLPEDSALDFLGATCGPIRSGQASCAATIGPSDGRGSASDALGNRVALSAPLSMAEPATCQATPAASFAGAFIRLDCTAVPAGATVNIPGAVCSPQDGHSALCTGTLGSGPGQLHDHPRVTTTLADGSSATTAIALSTWPPPTCAASPNPAREGGQVSVICAGVPPGAQTTLAHASCEPQASAQVRCTGVAGEGTGRISAHPRVTIQLDGQTVDMTVALTILPAQVTVLGSVVGDASGGKVLPASQSLELGQQATLQIDPAPDHLIDTLSADHCSPLTLTNADVGSPMHTSALTAALAADCTVSARFTRPLCSANPPRGFAGTAVLLHCSGLPAAGRLEIPGTSCSGTGGSEATCPGTIGQTDGSGSASNALGHTVTLPALLTTEVPAVCQAWPAAGFANTPVELRCTGLPPQATLSVAGAVCEAVETDGTLRCKGLSMGGGTPAPQAITTLDEGGQAGTPIRFQTLPPPSCHATPDPARSGTPVSIQCSGVPEGSSALLANGLCQVGNEGLAQCQGTAGLGVEGLGLNPSISFELNGGWAVIVTHLSLLDDPPPPQEPDGEGSLHPVPALGTTGLCALIVGLLFSARLPRRTGGKRRSRP